VLLGLEIVVLLFCCLKVVWAFLKARDFSMTTKDETKDKTQLEGTGGAGGGGAKHAASSKPSMRRSPGAAQPHDAAEPHDDSSRSQ
jgi:hypothetical protein